MENKENKQNKEIRNNEDHTENIEHQKELNNLEDVSPKHSEGFEKHKLEPSDMRNLKNQNN